MAGLAALTIRASDPCRHVLRPLPRTVEVGSGNSCENLAIANVRSGSIKDVEVQAEVVAACVECLSECVEHLPGAHQGVERGLVLVSCSGLVVLRDLRACNGHGGKEGKGCVDAKQSGAGGNGTLHGVGLTVVGSEGARKRAILARKLTQQSFIPHDTKMRKARSL